ncbi:hypothetical protein [Sphingomonas immobilis]|uniref:Uncharacterized protein n=1 Tax=Sphingomonas immobilis TaxID=3063997 RepID=A0ABT9A2D0_9SPHN|nr:hypothetical protein [Sphingomonas sp. CA1-15]MDO7843970.1 hypothetical protein [Sphingomonas sp. CA1-15]
MDFIPPDFAKVPYDSQTAGVCSPRVEDEDWRGIAINIPQRITIRRAETLKLPICGYYHLPTFPLLDTKMVVHVRGAGETKFDPVAGPVVVMDGPNEPVVTKPKKPRDPKMYRYSVSEEYFVLDGQRYFPAQLPPGDYEVMVTYGDARSNVARVTIARK